MLKILALVSLILSLVLFPPATLALISNNAVPGDKAYPIKRGLEDVIYAVASITPTSKAWFSAARSDRRFDEIGVLVAQGKKTEESLIELVAQTRITASQIAKISDPIQKEKLKVQLSTSIKKYEIAMEEFAKKESIALVSTTEPKVSAMPTVTARPTEAPGATTNPLSTGSPIPTQTSRPIVTAVPIATAIPTTTAVLSPTLAPTPNPTPRPDDKEDSPCDSIENPYRRVACELGRTEHGLNAQAGDVNNDNKDHEANKDSEKEKNKEKTKDKDKEKNGRKENSSGNR